VITDVLVRRPTTPFFNSGDGEFSAYARVLFQELVQCFAPLQIVNQGLKGDAGSPKNEFPAENVLVPDNGVLHHSILSPTEIGAPA
jgi:hypothetical protein